MHYAIVCPKCGVEDSARAELLVTYTATWAVDIDAQLGTVTFDKLDQDTHDEPSGENDIFYCIECPFDGTVQDFIRLVEE